MAVCRIKHIFTVIALSVMICTVLSGCSNDGNVQKMAVKSVFDCSFKADFDELKLCGKMSFNENCAKIVLLQPQTLKDVAITFEYDSKKLTLTDGSLKIELDEGKYPVTSFARLVAECIYDSVSNAASYNAADHAISGKIDGSSYIITVDNQGRPCKISLPDSKTAVQLYDYA